MDSNTPESCSLLAIQQAVESGKRRHIGLRLICFGFSAAMTFHQVFFVFVVVAINAKQFPIAAIRGVVVMVMVFVVNSQFAQPPAGKLTAAACAEMRKHCQCARPIALLALGNIPVQFLAFAFPLFRC